MEDLRLQLCEQIIIEALRPHTLPPFHRHHSARSFTFCLSSNVLLLLQAPPPPPKRALGWWSEKWINPPDRRRVSWAEYAERGMPGVVCCGRRPSEGRLSHPTRCKREEVRQRNAYFIATHSPPSRAWHDELQASRYRVLMKMDDDGTDE